MITELGKYLRKLRIDKMVTLRQMADEIGMSPAYLSSIETGKKNIPEGFIERTVKYFGLKDEAISALRKAADLSLQEISISMKNATQEQRNSAVFFARRLNQLSQDDLDKINKILEGK
jgi:transcriptional regulator with XRE-family HTH domain